MTDIISWLGQAEVDARRLREDPADRAEVAAVATFFDALSPETDS